MITDKQTLKLYKYRLKRTKLYFDSKSGNLSRKGSIYTALVNIPNYQLNKVLIIEKRGSEIHRLLFNKGYKISNFCTNPYFVRVFIPTSDFILEKV